MTNRGKAWIVGISVVVVTGFVCGGVLWNAWRNERVEEASEQMTENENIREIGENRLDAQELSAGEAKEKDQAAELPAENETQEEGRVTEASLQVLEDPRLYSYDDMMRDVQVLEMLYPDDFSAETLAQTADGRQVQLLVVGNPLAEKKIFVNGAIHGREYITGQLVMKQAAAFLRHLQNGDSYKEQPYRSLMEDCAIYAVPMVNPDGISISQYGLEGILTETVRKNVEHIAELDGCIPEGDYLTKWKANGNGVDLNRNFDALWDVYQDPAGHPSADHYKGTEPGCEAESAALISLTREQQFSRTISYHTQGGVIYWYFAQEGELYEKSLDFGERISHLTGYDLDGNYEDLDPAGYKDWAISAEKIPSLTIEVGRETSPVPSEQMEEIWNRNEYVWEETLLDVMEEQRG